MMSFSMEKSCKYHCLLVTVSFAFCVITFEPIKIEFSTSKCSLKLSFVKDIKVVVEKWLEMVAKRNLSFCELAKSEKRYLHFVP